MAVFLKKNFYKCLVKLVLGVGLSFISPYFGLHITNDQRCHRELIPFAIIVFREINVSIWCPSVRILLLRGGRPISVLPES